MSCSHRLTETLRALVATPSPQEDTAAVRRLVHDVVRPRLPLPYLDEVRIDDDGNLLAYRAGADQTLRPLLLLGYAATFPASGMADPFVPREMDGTKHGLRGMAMRGRGISEQLAAMAAALEALWRLADADARLERGLLFVTTVAGEMGSHEVVEAMTRHGDLDVSDAILVAGTGNALCLANMGRVDMEILIRGRSAHSSDPERGANAIDGAMMALERLRRVPLGAHPRLGRSTLTPTRLETRPEAMHTVPDTARLILDRRLVPGEEVETAMSQIREALTPLAPFSIEVRAGRFNLPSEVSSDAPLAAAVAEALRAVAGSAPVTHWRAALDAGFFVARGIPTVMFGPGDMRFAHTDDEVVSMPQVREGAEVYYRAVEVICGTR